jgi:hypothetical protein
MRAEAERMRAEEERMRAEAETEKSERKAEKMRRAADAKEAASKKRLETLAKTPGVNKPPALSKAEEVKKLQAQAQQAQAQQVQAQQAQADVAVPGRWYNPKSWLAWLSRKKGGTRKQCKQRTQRKSFTKRKHN